MGLFSLLTIVSAIISFISFAPFEFEWLILIGFVPLFFVLDNIKNNQLNTILKIKEYFFVSMTFGLVYMGLTNLWTFELIEFSSITEIIVLFVIYTLLQTLFYVLIFCSFGFFKSPLYLFGCYWIIFEYLKCLGPLGSPNGVLGYSLSNSYLAEYASYGGIYLLSLLIIYINYILFEIIKAGFKEGTRLKLIGILVVMVIIFTSPLVINLKEIKSNKKINIGLVQVNHPISYKLNSKNRRNIRNDYISLSKKALLDSELDLIIWPETITASENLKFPLFMNQVNDLSNKNNTAFIFGTPRKSRNQFYNSAAFVYNNSILFYDKHYLMPFGEYWPAKSLFKLLKLNNFIPGSEFTKGENKSTFNFKSIKLGVGICLETTMGFFYRDFANKDVNILVSLVNNGWFKDSSIAARQLQMLQIRAIETGLPILQSSNMGFTCVISHTGEIIKSISQFEQTYLTHQLNVSSIHTPYNKIGDIIILLSTLLIFLNILIRKILRKQYS